MRSRSPARGGGGGGGETPFPVQAAPNGRKGLRSSGGFPCGGGAAGSDLLLEELGEEKSRLLTQELAEQELALSSLVEEGVEWSVSEEEEEEEEYAEGWSPSEEEEKEEEYEEESVDDEEREPDLEFAPGGTK